ncbi:hypothetical protein BU25DRAFT_425535 [Macroventuria anomochaeta]|uniref:Uncharacterized protein n=1 Tax=Macroventuria anomochaeta TaxID=301207 RepID=A0ACB6RMG0_9PLEO|nr:uncharacterized protein BU25DRAFT_425535 [Macroventuria anomochaeta]KAF2622585.1 hypothetical protein BU25DRAFT_425535 [Macroventuria anomochaeta]
MATPPIKQRPSTKQPSSLELLLQRKKKMNDMLEDLVTYSRENNNYLQQQLRQSLVKTDKYRSHFSYLKDVVDQAESLGTINDSQVHNLDRWDIGDEVLDDDAVELGCNDTTLITELAEENEQAHDTSNMKSTLNSINADTSGPTRPEEFSDSEYSTVTGSLLNSPLLDDPIPPVR